MKSSGPRPAGPRAGGNAPPAPPGGHLEMVSLVNPYQVRARIKRILGDMNCRYVSDPFSVSLQFPLSSQVQVFSPGGGWRILPSVAAVGSPSCRDLEGPVVPVGTGGPDEYRLGGTRYRGSVVVAGVGSHPLRDVVLTARDHGALAALLYRPDGPSVRAVAPDPHLPVPTVCVGREALTALGRPEARVRIHVESEERPLTFENIFLQHGEGPLHVLLRTHYDTRPLRLGPGGQPLGVAVMLSLLTTMALPSDRRITFAFLDGEELGSLGSARFLREVRSGTLTPPDLEIDLNALGTRRDLGVKVEHPKGVARDLEAVARQAFQAAGLGFVSRDPDQTVYGGLPHRRGAWPVVALGGRPDRHVPSWQQGQPGPDRWGVARLAEAIATIVRDAGA